MSYYEQQPQSPAWQQQAQRQSWDTRSTVSTPGQPTFNRAEVHGPPSDLTTRYTAQMKPEDPAAFGSQLDEVERAMDNLVKSGKMFTPPRRESMSLMGPRGFPLEPHNPRMVTPPVRHYPLPAEFDAVRSPSATNLQNFYATQRFQPSRAQEPETMIQAKRRAAAQRERELRNYHQEQQYNRTVLADINPYGKDRVVSPGAMSEEDRRDLIARQHRALYSAQSEGGAHSEDGHHDEGTQRNLNLHSNGASAPTSNNGGTRVQTPSTELPASNGTQPGAVSPSHARSISGSPSSSVGFSLTNSRVAGVHGLASRTTASSPGGSPPRSQRGSVPPSSSVAPIGTRPVQNAALNNAKRATTPLASPLSYGFAANEADPFNHQFQQQQNSRPQERSASAASSEQHSSTGGQGGSEGLGWSTKVWGSSGNKGLGMNSMSVWG